MKIYLGGDHRGFKLKEKIIEWLSNWKYDFQDMGAFKFDPKDDYPFIAEKVASVVADNEGSRGILLCGSGVGVDVVANKFDRIRASIGKNSAQVKAGRHDDDFNILVVAADFTDEKEVKEMVKTFLETEFGGKERYQRRLADITKIEENN